MAEVLELTDVVAHPPVEVDAGVVVAGAEVEEWRVGVGEEVPDDHQDGSADGNDCPLGAPASGDAPVALAEEGIGAAGADGGLAQDPGEVAVAVPGARVALLAPGGL